MPTNRTRKHRNQRIKLTAEMVALFRQGEPLRAIYDAHLAAGNCGGSAAPGRGHCADCDEFVEVSKRLNWRLLGLSPGHISVFDAALDKGGPAPSWMKHLCAYATWEPARRLRAALRAAAAAQERADAVLIDGALRQ